MAVQSDFLGLKELKELSSRRRGELHNALEDLLSSDVSIRSKALDRISKMDAHRRSPLAVALLACRITESNLSIRARIVNLLAAVVKVDVKAERPPARVREILHDALCGMGEREILCLLQLITKDGSMLDPVCSLLDQCSSSGGILVDIVNQREFDVPLRIAAADGIAQVGFLEAKDPIESLEKRLVNRIAGQLSMAFASYSQEETEKLIPVLRRTLDVLEEAGV